MKPAEKKNSCQTGTIKFRSAFKKYIICTVRDKDFFYSNKITF